MIFLSISLMFAAGALQTNAQVKSYKIGAVFSITGPASWLGEPERNTAVMLTESINQKGGINGVPIEDYSKVVEMETKNKGKLKPTDYGRIIDFVFARKTLKP